MKICIITTTRAEYGILKPLIQGISKDKFFDSKIIVSGLHLLKEYGETIEEIRKDGFSIDQEIEMYDSNKDQGYYGRGLSRGILNFTNYFVQSKPDLVVVFGDRLEMLAATLAASTLGIPIAHIHGGDKTNSGHIDEKTRHALTRFANIHFTATKDHYQRIKKMGEESWRIFNVGALGIDSIANIKTEPKTILFKRLGLNTEKPVAVCLFHPIDSQSSESGKQMEIILNSLHKYDLSIAVIYPNNDNGSEGIITQIEKERGNKNVVIFKNIQHDDYINLLKNSAFLIGNSSGGIIESPWLKLPVINVGERNKNRGKSSNIIFANPKEKELVSAIKKVLYDKKFLARAKKASNIYGNGQASGKISATIKKIWQDPRIKIKKITY